MCGRERELVCDGEAAAHTGAGTSQNWSNPPAIRRHTESRLSRQRAGELLPKTSTETREDMRAAAL